MNMLPGGTGLVNINSKLRRGALVVLEERSAEAEVNPNLDQMIGGLEKLEEVAKSKKYWKCPNSGCDVEFADKYKQIVST